jgi:hypothetical protein
MNHETCLKHTGVVSDIEHLKSSLSDHQARIAELDNRIDMIMTRLNVILGGMVVSVIALLLNLIVRIV